MPFFFLWRLEDLQFSLNNTWKVIWCDGVCLSPKAYHQRHQELLDFSKSPVTDHIQDRHILLLISLKCICYTKKGKHSLLKDILTTSVYLEILYMSNLQKLFHFLLPNLLMIRDQWQSNKTIPWTVYRNSQEQKSKI